MGKRENRTAFTPRVGLLHFVETRGVLKTYCTGEPVQPPFQTPHKCCVTCEECLKKLKNDNPSEDFTEL